MLQEQTFEDISVKTLRLVPVLIAALMLFTAGSSAAQSRSAIAGCTWNCHRIDLPLGLTVVEVAAGGSFVTLDDGSVWEIRMPQRPVAASWVPGTFVELRNVHAPVDRFRIVLEHGDTDRAEARLAGRKPPAGAGGQH
jgi:hypothetical protein